MCCHRAPTILRKSPWRRLLHARNPKSTDRPKLKPRNSGAFVWNFPSYNAAMNSEASELLKRALALSTEERAALADVLLDSLEASDEDVQQAWNDEVARRIESLRTGKASTTPWEALHREL